MHCHKKEREGLLGPYMLLHASNYGIGAVLSQDGPDGKEHRIVNLSRKQLAREENYSVPEKK